MVESDGLEESIMSHTITEPNILAFVFSIGFPNQSAFLLVVTKPGRKCCWLEAPFVKSQNNLTFRLFIVQSSSKFYRPFCTLYRLHIKYVYIGNIPFSLEGYQSSNINFRGARVIFPITDFGFHPPLSSVSIRV